MKISCPACGAKYRIPDDRVRGKNRVFRINCKKCSSEIRVRGIATQQDDGRTTMPFNLEMPDTAPATPQRVWFAGIEGKQVGPLTEQEVLDHIIGGRLSGDDLVWRKGFGAWTPVREVSPFQSKVNEAGAAASAADKSRTPRRSQTLELSAAMIELLVKLDAQQGAESGEGGGAVPDVEPPSLPPLDAGKSEDVPPPVTKAAAPVKEAAPAKEVAPPPIKPEPVEAKPETTSKAPATETKPPVVKAAAAVVEGPPPVPKTETPPAIPAEETRPPVPANTVKAKAVSKAEAKAAQPSIVVKTTKSQKTAPGKSSKKVSLPGQATSETGAASEAETQITTVPVEKTPATTKGGRNKRSSRKKRNSAANRGSAAATTTAKGTAARKTTAATDKKTNVAAKSTTKKATAKAAVKPSSKRPATAAAKKSAAGAKGATKAKAAKKEEEKSGGFGWVIGLVLLVGLIGSGVYYAKMLQKKKAKAPTKPTAVAAAEPAAPAAAVVAEAKPEPAPVDAGAAEPAAPEVVDAGAPEVDAGAATADAGSADAGAAADAGAVAAADTGNTAQVADEKAPADTAAAAAPASDDEPKKDEKREARRRRDNRKEDSGAGRSRKENKAAAKPAPDVPKKDRDEIDILLEKGRERERKAAAEKAAAAKAAAAKKPAPPPAAKPKGDSIDEILRREAARKAAEAAKRKAANTPAPPPSSGAPGSGKTLTAKQVSKIAKSAKSKVMDCYMDHGDVDGGRVTFKVRIYVTAAGSVQNAKVMGRSGSGALGSCISTKVKTLRFPQSSGGTKKYTVRYTVGG